MATRIELEQRLNALRRVLLNLHKALLEAERVRYERGHGRVTSGRLLQLAIGDPQFAWLRPLTELAVRIDQAIDADEPPTDADVKALAVHARALLVPGDAETPFARRYLEMLQTNPDIVLAHREAMLHLQPPRETRSRDAHSSTN